MDDDLIKTVFRLAISLTAMYAAYWFVAAMNKPDWFNENLGFHRNLQDGYTQNPKPLQSHWFQFTVLLIGFGSLGYFLSYGFIWWMPFEWGAVGEDGEFSPLRNSVQGLIGLGSSIGFIGCVENYVEPIRQAKLRKESDERYAAREAMLRREAARETRGLL